MGRLIFLLLGEDFLRGRWPLFRIAGWISTIAGIFLFIDALDGALYFPITFFAILLLIEGAGTLATTALGAGGQRWLRFFKGSFALLASGLILAGRLGTGYPLAGAGFELDAIVAVALGGTALAGGRGSVIRSLAGVALLAIMSNALNLLEVTAFVQMLIKGLVVIVAILLNQPPRESQ